MLAQAEQLLQRGSSVSGSLLPAIFAIFKQWQLTGAQQMTLLGLTNEKTLYNALHRLTVFKQTKKGKKKEPVEETETNDSIGSTDELVGESAEVVVSDESVEKASLEQTDLDSSER